MRLSKESQLLELNSKQVNKRLKNVLDQKLQVLDTLKEEQRRGHERSMTQLVLKTARYHHRIEELQEVVERRNVLRRKVPTEDKAVETSKLPPLQQHTNLKKKMFNLVQAKQNHLLTRTQFRLPPI